MLGGLDYHSIAAHVRRALATVGVTLGSVDAAALAINGGAVWSTADVKTTYKVVADAGWVMHNDGTLGNASSGATARANADTAALFAHFWNTTDDADCPVSTGRGASAAADFAAGKTIALPKQLGRAIAVAGSGAGLTARALGSADGAETQVIGTTHLPASGLSIPGLSIPSLSVAGTAAGQTINEHNGAADGSQPRAFPAGATQLAFEQVTALSGATNASAVTGSTGTGTTGTGTTGNMGAGNALPILNPRGHLNVMIKL